MMRFYDTEWITVYFDDGMSHSLTPIQNSWLDTNIGIRRMEFMNEDGEWCYPKFNTLGFHNIDSAFWFWIACA